MPPALPASDETPTAPQSVDEIVAALLDDPVLVAPSMGNGHTEQVDAALTELAAEAGRASGLTPYVVLVDQPPGLSTDQPTQDLARVLHARLGEAGADEDALLVVAFPWQSLSTTAFGLPWEREHDLGSTVWATQESVRPEFTDSGEPVPTAAAEAAIALEVYADPDAPLDAQEHELYATSPVWTYPQAPESPEPPTTGWFTFVAVAAGVFVFLVAWRLLRARHAQTPLPAPVPDIEQVRRDARRETELLERALSPRRRPRQVTDATGCHAAALELLDSTDLLDVVGALVLARTGLALTRARPDQPPYRCCFYNPLHGGARRTITAPAGRVATLTVPVCARCERVRDDPDEFVPLHAPGGRLRESRPYYAGDSVWARTGYGTLVDDLWQQVAADRRVGGRR